MKRTSTYLGLGGTLLAAALLVACGGGGSGSSGASSIPSTVQNPGGTSSGASSTRSMKLVIAVPTNVKRHTSARTKGAKRRNYVSMYAAGLQLAVTPTGGSTTTLYADISSTSPLCNGVSEPQTQPNGAERLCSIPIPALAATESVTATEVDQTPSSEGSSGFGTGFAGGDVLGVGTTTVTTTGGVNTVALGISPIAAFLYDCVYSPFIPSDGANGEYFADDVSENADRVVVTDGMASQGILSQYFGDPANGWYDALPTPAPGFSPVPQDFVDVNGSPEPITYAASTSNITLAPYTGPSTPPVSGAYAQSGSIATDADYFNDCMFIFGVKVGALPTPAPGATPTVQTIAMSNNLSATAPSPFTSGPYPVTLTYTIVPISASPATVSSTMSGSPTVTGWDYQAGASGMGAESAYTADDGKCFDTGTPTQEDASISAGALDNTTWTQVFTITPMHTGTCTFMLYDADTYVVTQPVTVTVGP